MKYDGATEVTEETKALSVERVMELFRSAAIPEDLVLEGEEWHSSLLGMFNAILDTVHPGLRLCLQAPSEEVKWGENGSCIPEENFALWLESNDRGWEHWAPWVRENYQDGQFHIRPEVDLPIAVHPRHLPTVLRQIADHLEKYDEAVTLA